MKRILALLGALLLIALYVMTLVFALIGSDWAMTALKISLLCTIAIPCLLYAMIMVYRLLNKKN